MTQYTVYHTDYKSMEVTKIKSFSDQDEAFELIDQLKAVQPSDEWQWYDWEEED